MTDKIVLKNVRFSFPDLPKIGVDAIEPLDETVVWHFEPFTLSPDAIAALREMHNKHMDEIAFDMATNAQAAHRGINRTIRKNAHDPVRHTALQEAQRQVFRIVEAYLDAAIEVRKRQIHAEG